MRLKSFCEVPIVVKHLGIKVVLTERENLLMNKVGQKHLQKNIQIT